MISDSLLLMGEANQLDETVGSASQSPFFLEQEPCLSSLQETYLQAQRCSLESGLVSMAGSRRGV